MTALEIEREISYCKGYDAAMDEMQKRKQEIQRRQRVKKMLRRNKIRRMAAGSGILAYTGFAIACTGGDAGIAALTVPMAIACYTGALDTKE